MPVWIAPVTRAAFAALAENVGPPAGQVDRNTVDVVMCTHLHFDHVGWNTRIENGRWVPTRVSEITSTADRSAAFDSTAYMGVGKREEIRQFVQEQQDASDGVAQVDPHAVSNAVDYILVDHEISPSQALNLENEVGCEVMDRTVVILEIFHRNASSHAARIQVEIARLTYMAPRLREAAKREGPSGRQRSGVGGRGSGQSRSEIDSRKVRDRIAELQIEIERIEDVPAARASVGREISGFECGLHFGLVPVLHRRRLRKHRLAR